MSWDALGTVGLRAVSTSQVLWQGCSRRAVAIPAWDLGVFCSGLWGCPAWVSLKAGSSRGPGRAAGSQQAVLLLPTAQGVHAGKVGAGHCAPQRSACPACAPGSPGPVPAVLGARPSCACSWKKHLSRGRAVHICPSAPQPGPAFPVSASPPSQPSPQPRLGESRSGPCPCRVKAAGTGRAPCRGFVVPERRGVLAGETFCPNSPHCVTPAPHCPLWSPVPIGAGCHPGKVAEE